MTNAAYINDPLGDGDATAKREDIEEFYLDIRNFIQPSDLAPASIVKTKLVFGAKGAGKTHLLLYIEKLSERSGHVPVYCALSQTRLIHAKTQAYRGELSSEEAVFLWSDVWRISFNLSVLSWFMCETPSPKAREALSNFIERRLPEESKSSGYPQLRREFLRYINNAYAPINWHHESKVTPLAAIDMIVNRFKHLNSIRHDLIDILNIESLENDIAELLRGFGKFHFIIDSLDEFAYNDPRGWSELQYGLFKSIFLMTKVREYAQSIMVTAAMRNYMYDIIAEDPQFDRAKSYITRLRWDRSAASQFLTAVLVGIKDHRFARAQHLDASRPLASWLGFDTVDLNGRGISEEVENYLLRHTRLSPRQIVEAFNNLAADQNRAESEGAQISPVEFRKLIAARARENGRMMLKTAAEEMMAQIPEIQQAVSNTLRGSATPQTMVGYFADEVQALIASCEDEVIFLQDFRRKIVDPILDSFQISLPGPASAPLRKRVETVLWRSGIFAYQRIVDDSTYWEFSWSREAGAGGMPHHSQLAGFHSTLIDVCNLKASKDGPVF